MNRGVSAVGFTMLGAFILASFFWLGDVWRAIDETVFFFFNLRLVPESPVLTVAAYTNMRSFDLVALCAMGGLYLWYFARQDNAGRRKMVCLGLCMLLAGIIIKHCGRLFPISRPSPTLVFENVNRLSGLTNIAAKDASRNSFPGDHGMMLMIYAGFMARYFGKRAFMAACAIVVVFSLPRIMSGAHWVSDIYMGSLGISCIALSWLLLTPASEYCAAFFERVLPKGLFPPERAA